MLGPHATLALLGAALAAAPPPPDLAAAVGTAVNGTAKISASLVADVISVAPGDAFHVGVQVQMAPGWHIYGLHPGAAGYPTEVRWSSGDAAVGATAWPAVSTFREDGGVVTYGYAENVLLAADATASDSVAGSVEVTAELRYLACHTLCSPGQVRLRRRLPVSAVPAAADAPTLAAFAAARARLPRPPEAEGVRLTVLQDHVPLRPGDDLRLALRAERCPPGGGCVRLRGRAEDAWASAWPAAAPVQAMASAGPEPSLWLHGHVGARLEAVPAALEGQLFLREGEVDLPPLQVRLPLEVGPAGAATVASADPLFAKMPAGPADPSRALDEQATPLLAWWQALALALVGGLVLNLMPCVLPVLGIKLVSLAAGEAKPRRQRLAEALAYTAGVVGALEVLALVVVVLRHLGTQVGWGFQFQEPGFVAAVSTVLVLFSLNCFGTFELSAGANRLAARARRAAGLSRSLWEGTLAVVLATPCSAPFLGTAVAFALSGSDALIATTFLCIGLGLAAPYVALLLIPGQRGWLPRPGPWMQRLKELMGFGLLATAIWLVWIVGRFNGIDAMARLLVFLLGISLLAWIWGHVVRRHPAHPLLFGLGLLGGALAVATTALAIRPEGPEPAARAADALAWRPYSHPAVLAELMANRPVFVEFTADWCITCKFNEARVLRAPAVRAAFAASHATLMRADWTRRDPSLQAILTSFGRAGVPMYLVYRPERPEGPRLLPELISAADVVAALEGQSRPSL